MVSKQASVCSFGSPHPRAQFLTDIKSKCQNGHNPDTTFPGWHRKYDYHIWTRRASTFGHESVAIRCVDESEQYLYLTIHLYVNKQYETVEPHAKFISDAEANEEMASKKMQYKREVRKQLSMRQFAKLAIDLIEHHGQYSAIANNCQNFAAAFAFLVRPKRACFLHLPGLHCPNCNVQQTSSTENALVLRTVAAATAVGFIVGSALGGPPAAFIGAETGYSCAIVGTAAVSMPIAKKANKNGYHKVKDTEHQNTMSEKAWMQWELRIMTLQNSNAIDTDGWTWI